MPKQSSNKEESKLDIVASKIWLQVLSALGEPAILVLIGGALLIGVVLSIFGFYGYAIGFFLGSLLSALNLLVLLKKLVSYVSRASTGVSKLAASLSAIFRLFLIACLAVGIMIVSRKIGLGLAIGLLFSQGFTIVSLLKLVKKASEASPGANR